MAEYIEREAVLELLTNRDVVINPHDEVAYIKEDVECLPAADMRPVVRGTWITRPYMMGNTQYCSLCGENYGMKHNFCPNCGADMREETE